MRSQATLAKVRDETLAGAQKWRSELDSAAARHYELLASARRAAKARQDCQDKAPDTLLILHKIYNECRMVMVKAHAAE